MTQVAIDGDEEQDRTEYESKKMEAGEAYDTIAQVYDAHYGDPKSLAEDRVIFQQLIEFGAVKGRVLDVGCGTGILLDKLPISVENYVGIDPSSGMLDVARRKFPSHTFVKSTAECPRLPYDEPFDSVVSLYGSFSYVLDPILAVHEMSRLLRPGGRLFIMSCTPVHERRETYVMNKMGIKVERRFYEEDQIRRLFSHEFEDIQVQGFGWLIDKIPHVMPQWMFHLAMTAEMETIGRSLPDLCCYNIVSARRV